MKPLNDVVIKDCPFRQGYCLTSAIKSALMKLTGYKNLDYHEIDIIFQYGDIRVEKRERYDPSTNTYKNIKEYVTADANKVINSNKYEIYAAISLFREYMYTYMKKHITPINEKDTYDKWMLCKWNINFNEKKHEGDDKIVDLDTYHRQANWYVSVIKEKLKEVRDEHDELVRIDPRIIAAAKEMDRRREAAEWKTDYTPDEDSMEYVDKELQNKYMYEYTKDIFMDHIDSIINENKNLANTNEDSDLSDIKSEWHPKEGIFLEKDPKRIAGYLLRHSDSKGHAMKRLVFYMNRAGENLKNKTVLNKVKKMLAEGCGIEDVRIERLNEDLICEDYESKKEHACIEDIMRVRKCDKEKATNLFNEMRGTVPNCGLPLYQADNSKRYKRTYKFFPGLLNMFTNKEITPQNACDINEIMEYVASPEYDGKYNIMLNGLTADELISEFAPIIHAAREKARQYAMEHRRDLTPNEHYEIVHIPDYKTARKYSKYTEWCIVLGQKYFDRYAGHGKCTYYFCLNDGYQYLMPRCGDEYPLDEYGLSMIAVCVNYDGSLRSVTCRWNTASMTDPNRTVNKIMSIEELENILGRNFYETFVPVGEYDPESCPRQISNDIIREKLVGKIRLQNIFDFVGTSYEGMKPVRVDDLGYNFITSDRRLLSDTWYDKVEIFTNGFAKVNISRRGWNYIDKKGDLLLKHWYDDVSPFDKNGFTTINDGGTTRIIDKDGNIYFPSGRIVSDKA